MVSDNKLQSANLKSKIQSSDAEIPNWDWNWHLNKIFDLLSSIVAGSVGAKLGVLAPHYYYRLHLHFTKGQGEFGIWFP